MDVYVSSFYLTIQPFLIQRNTTLSFVKCTYILRPNSWFIQQITLSFCFATMSRNIIHYLLCLCLCHLITNACWYLYLVFITFWCSPHFLNTVAKSLCSNRIYSPCHPFHYFTFTSTGSWVIAQVDTTSAKYRGEQSRWSPAWSDRADNVQEGLSVTWSFNSNMEAPVFLNITWHHLSCPWHMGSVWALIF